MNITAAGAYFRQWYPLTGDNFWPSLLR